MYNQNSGYGAALLQQVHGIVPTFGRIFVVFAPGDIGEERYERARMVFKNDPAGKVRLFKGTNGFSDALDAVTSNNNDVILLDGDGVHALATGYALTKNRVNVIGMDSGGRLVQQGAKVQLSGAVDSAYVLKDTGVRNSFRNIKFIQSSTHANALTVLQLGGEGGLFKNCSAVFGVANNLGSANAHEVVTGSDSYTYEDCTFGSDTLLTSAARSVFHIDQVTASQEFKSNILRRCIFLISSSSSTATFVRLDAVGDVLFTNIFDECTFAASVDSAGGAAIAEAAQTGTGTTKGTLLFRNPAAFNCTDFSTATSGRNANIQVVGISPTAGTAGVGVQPTA